MSEKASRVPPWLAPVASGAVGGTGIGVLLAVGLGMAAPFAVGVGSVVGAGIALLGAPMGPSLIEGPAREPTSVTGMLGEATASAARMDEAMRRLASRPLWAGTTLDEDIASQIGRIRTLAATPALQRRPGVDGDVRMLYVLATDYLPTIVNLAIENDRMHVSFTGRHSREDVEANIRGLDEQTGVLGEVLDRIESDIVRGTTQDVEQHAAFLRSRFAETGSSSVLDLSTPFNPTSPPPPKESL